jgi:hypothetical protein
MSAPDLTDAIRAALVADAGVTQHLSDYLGSFPIFTRRPVPGDAPYPCIVVSQDIAVSDEDGVNDYRASIMRDIAVYHTNETPDNEHVVEALGQAVRRTFHRQRQSLTVNGWDVARIEASVPIEAPVDNDQRTGCIVQLQVLMAAN